MGRGRKNVGEATLLGCLFPTKAVTVWWDFLSFLFYKWKRANLSGIVHWVSDRIGGALGSVVLGQVALAAVTAHEFLAFSTVWTVTRLLSPLCFLCSRSVRQSLVWYHGRAAQPPASSRGPEQPSLQAAGAGISAWSSGKCTCPSGLLLRCFLPFLL